MADGQNIIRGSKLLFRVVGDNENQKECSKIIWLIKQGQHKKGVHKSSKGQHFILITCD